MKVSIMNRMLYLLVWLVCVYMFIGLISFMFIDLILVLLVLCSCCCVCDVSEDIVYCVLKFCVFILCWLGRKLLLNSGCGYGECSVMWLLLFIGIIVSEWLLFSISDSFIVLVFSMLLWLLLNGVRFMCRLVVMLCIGFGLGNRFSVCLFMCSCGELISLCMLVMFMVRYGVLYMWLFLVG